MAATTPPPPPPPPPTSEAAQPDPAPRRGGRKAAVAAGGVVVAAALIGGGAFAYNQVSGGGAQPQDVMPSTVDVFARIDLDPSAGQKVELFKFLRKFPDAAKSVGISDDRDDLRRLVFEQVGESCPDVDYDDDVEPWLGERVGIGVGADAPDEDIVIAVQVSDEDAAKDGIAKLFACSDDEYGIAFSEGYALLSPSQKTVDAAVDDAAKETLADAEAFSADMEALGETGVASAWINAEELGPRLAELTGGAALGDASVQQQLEDAGTAAIALRVDGDAAELAGVSSSAAAIDADPVDLGDLPSDTVLGLSFSGAGEQVAKQWPAIEEQISALGALGSGFGGPSTTPTIPPEVLEQMDPETRQRYEDLQGDAGSSTPSDPLGDFEQATGLSLPDDLEALLGSTFTLAIGSTNLERLPELSSPADVQQLNVALRSTGDASGALAVMQKLAGLARDQAGVTLVTESDDDSAVLATSSDAAEQLIDGGDLGDADGFGAVMPFGDDTVQALYVDVDGITEKILDANPPQEIADALEQAGQIDAAGFSIAKDGDRGRFSLRLAFK